MPEGRADACRPNEFEPFGIQRLFIFSSCGKWNGVEPQWWCCKMQPQSVSLPIYI